MIDIFFTLLFLLGTISFLFGFAIAFLAKELTFEGMYFVMKFLVFGFVLSIGTILIRHYSLI
jgi:hypothetical protein